MKTTSRYEFISIICAAFGGIVSVPIRALTSNTERKDTNMYGLIGKMTVNAGQRDKLIEILLESATDMPGCLSYIVSKDTKDNSVIWVTEVWDSEESHKQSLKLPSVQEAMNQGRPLISEFNEQIKMEPVGGHGLVVTERK